jgi:hypothetical protein
VRTKIVREIGAGERAITVGHAIDAFIDDPVDMQPFRTRIEFGAARFRDAMDGPRTAELRERRVIGRMPIARRIDSAKTRSQRGDRREDALAVRDAQSAAR